MPFEETRRRLFPGARPLGDYAAFTRQVLEPYGFAPDNSLLMLGACRDELSTPMFVEMQERWGSAFGIAGLAGMPFLGRTGVESASHHVPDGQGVKRYVAVLTTHIGIDVDGSVGKCRREGQIEQSSACGALVKFRNELASGHAVTQMDPDDPEMSLLRLRLLRELTYGQVPDLADLTRTVRDVITDEFRHIAAGVLDDEQTMVSVMSAIMVHSPFGDWMDPGVAEIHLPDGVVDLPTFVAG